jgi:hypothetical protein
MAESQGCIPLVIGDQLEYIKASIDFPAHLLEVIMEALKDRPKTAGIDIDFKPRRSHASFKEDKLEAFDLPVSYCKASTNLQASQQVLELAMWLHEKHNLLVMSGFVGGMHLDRNEDIASSNVCYAVFS